MGNVYIWYMKCYGKENNCLFFVSTSGKQDGVMRIDALSSLKDVFQRTHLRKTGSISAGSDPI
jgi:hypothetical protein